MSRRSWTRLWSLWKWKLLSHVWLFATPWTIVLVAQFMSDSFRPHGLPRSLVHGIFQASVLEWVAISFSRGSSWPRDRTQVSHIAGRFFTLWITQESATDKYVNEWSHVPIKPDLQKHANGRALVHRPQLANPWLKDGFSKTRQANQALCRYSIKSIDYNLYFKVFYLKYLKYLLHFKVVFKVIMV